MPKTTIKDLYHKWPGSNAEVRFQGLLGTKTLVFQGEQERFFTSSIISEDESVAWKACEEMLFYAVKRATAEVSGFYGLELLSVSLSQGIQRFDANALAQLVVNHAAKLEPGAKRIFPYGSLLFLLHKRIPNEWGKIDFKTYVEVFRKPRAQMDLLIKKKVAEVLKSEYDLSQSKLLIIDLSQESLFRFGQEDQTERIAAFFIKNRKALELSKLGVFYQDARNGMIDLAEQFSA